MRIQIQPVDDLPSIGEADPRDAGPGGEGAIIVAAALPQPPPFGVEGQQRRDDHGSVFNRL